MEEKKNIELLINDKDIVFSSLTSMVMKEKYKGMFDTPLNIESLDQENKENILSDLLEYESNCVGMQSQAMMEEIAPELIDPHRKLFNNINKVNSIIGFKICNNEDPTQYKIEKYKELLCDINDYSQIMKQICDNKQKQL